MMEQEYTLNDEMDSFEDLISSLIEDMHSYNLIEFYHDQESIVGQIRRVKDQMKEFKLYMPKYTLADTDLEKIYHQIRVDLKERINAIIQPLDRKCL